MQGAHRRNHRRVWLLLTVLVGIGFTAAIALRQPTVIEETRFERAGAGGAAEAGGQ